MSGKRISREKLTMIKKMIMNKRNARSKASAEPVDYEALFVYAQKRLDKMCVRREIQACKQCPCTVTSLQRREEG